MPSTHAKLVSLKGGPFPNQEPMLPNQAVESKGNNAAHGGGALKKWRRNELSSEERTKTAATARQQTTQRKQNPLFSWTDQAVDAE
jgi:hypothetical protein